jgi:hypothetical protein
MIEIFPLAERDVASFFTLPKAIYGRQPLIVEITYVIQHTASVFKSTGSKRDKSHGSGSTVPTITSASDLLHHQRTLSDSASETALSNHDLSSFNTGTKSNTSPSYCSGSDYSGGNGRLTSGKQGVEIVCLSGPGGVGKSTLFNAVQTVARQEG